MQTGDLAGVEALLRWNGENGLVSPSEFIPVAETSGLIIPLGEWVLREVCAQKLAWEQAGLPAIPVAVNLSAVQLRQDETVERLIQVIEESGVEPSELEIEITESALMEKEECTARRLGIFRELGVRLTIDDFGTGYSSLSHLKQLSVDALKIDCSFVRDIGVDADDAAIAKAIIQLGASLNLTVVAEGLETIGHAEFLIQQGCQLAQGYYYSPALDADSFVSWLRSRTSGNASLCPAQYSGS